MPNLKQVDSSFMDDFFAGIESVEDPNVSAEDAVDTVDPVLETNSDVDDTTKGKPKSVLNINKEDFNFTDLVDDDEPEGPLSRKSVNKNDPISTTKTISDSFDVNALIEEGLLTGFDEEGFSVKSNEDLKELLIANKEAWEKAVRDENVSDYFEDTPEEFKIALDYVKNGGTDIKSLFRTLAESKDLSDIATGTDDRSKVKVYLEQTQFGTPEEIEDQLDEWEDSELLAKKASMFSPKLEKIAEQRNAEMIKKQAALVKQQEELADQFYSGIETALKEKELNGIALSREESKEIKKALTENSFTSTRTGRPLNLLGNFLEEITWVKPDYALLSELALFAKDPEAYREKLRKQGRESEVDSVARKLKSSNRVQDNNFVNDDNVTRNKRVVVPRSSGLLKRRKI